MKLWQVLAALAVYELFLKPKAPSSRETLSPDLLVARQRVAVSGDRLDGQVFS